MLTQDYCQGTRRSHLCVLCSVINSRPILFSLKSLPTIHAFDLLIPTFVIRHAGLCKKADKGKLLIQNTTVASIEKVVFRKEIQNKMHKNSFQKHN